MVKVDVGYSCFARQAVYRRLWDTDGDKPLVEIACHFVGICVDYAHRVFLDDVYEKRNLE
jgi:hypothetical protein